VVILIFLTLSISSPASNLFCSLVHGNFLTQMVNFSTRQENILDLVLVNHVDIISNVHPIDGLPGTDHKAILFDICVVPSTHHHGRRFLYNYHKTNFTIFCDTLCHMPWNSISRSDVEKAWSLWRDMFFGAADAAIPKVHLRRSKMKHWFSYDTIHLIRLKRCLCNKIIKFPNSDVIRSK